MLRMSTTIALLALAGCGDDVVPVAGTGGAGGGTGGARDGSGGSAGHGGAVGGGGHGGGTDPAVDEVVSAADTPRILRCAGDRLVWLSHSLGDVHLMAPDGTSSTMIARGVAPYALDAVVDGRGAVAAIRSQEIVRVPMAGGPILPVSTDGLISGAAAHNGTLYWISDGEVRDESGATYAIPERASAVAVDASGVYVTGSRGGVYRFVGDGMPAEKIGEAHMAWDNVAAIDGECLVWGTASALLRWCPQSGSVETVASTPAFRLSVLGDWYAWMSDDAVYVARRDGEPRRVAPVTSSGHVALCGGFVFWSSPIDGTVLRATLQ